MRFLSVEVYRAKNYPDCSNNGVSETAKYVFVPCDSGPFKMEDIGQDDAILTPLENGRKYFVVEGEKRQAMFGGAFIWSSDSRFRQVYGDYPIPLHDRIE